jgi:hypothetical protein
MVESLRKGGNKKHEVPCSDCATKKLAEPASNLGEYV